MDNKKKQTILIFLIMLAIVILIGVGSTFAYFTASIGSKENALSATAAVFKIDLIDDTELIKKNMIPSEEKYVDMAINRLDASGNFLKPYEENGETIKEGTTCIDDNLFEICSIYTFTISNPTSTDLPLYITLIPSVNTFENLYYKVVDKDLNEVISATKLVDDREYTLDASGNKVYKADSTISPVVLTEINKTLPKATDEKTPSTVKYSIVMWIMETGENQTTEDSGKRFAATLNVNASGEEGKGITGTLSVTGVE